MQNEAFEVTSSNSNINSAPLHHPRSYSINAIRKKIKNEYITQQSETKIQNSTRLATLSIKFFQCTPVKKSLRIPQLSQQQFVTTPHQVMHHYKKKRIIPRQQLLHIPPALPCFGCCEKSCYWRTFGNQRKSRGAASRRGSRHNGWVGFQRGGSRLVLTDDSEPMHIDTHNRELECHNGRNRERAAIIMRKMQPMAFFLSQSDG